MPAAADVEERATSAAAPPGVNAPKADWVAYAITRGLDAGEAEALTKQELVARYGR